MNYMHDLFLCMNYVIKGIIFDKKIVICLTLASLEEKEVALLAPLKEKG